MANPPLRALQAQSIIYLQSRPFKSLHLGGSPPAVQNWQHPCFRAAFFRPASSVYWENLLLTGVSEPDFCVDKGKIRAYDGVQEAMASLMR